MPSAEQSHRPTIPIDGDRRLHGLDWLRAVATVLVVLLHAGLAYTLTPFPGLAWPTHDSHPSPFVDGVVWWIDSMIMPLFFVLSGWVAADLMARRGIGGFVRHRTRRVLVPLLLGCVVILPLDLYIWLLGWVIDGKIPLQKLRSLKLDPALSRDLIGPAHLWYLQYLFLFCLAASGVAAVCARWPGLKNWCARLARWCRRHPVVAPAALALLSGLALWWQPRIVIGFRHSWHPLPANILYFAPCFAAGWWLERRHAAVNQVGAVFRWQLAAHALCFAAVLPLLREHTVAEHTGLARIAMIALFTGSAWFGALGWFGGFLHLRRKPPRSIAYVAEASFWVYLFHQPMVGLSQVALGAAVLPAAVKFALASSVALALSLMTYEVAVRRTWVGRLLAGQFRRRVITSVPESAAGASPARRAS